VGGQPGFGNKRHGAGILVYPLFHLVHGQCAGAEHIVRVQLGRDGVCTDTLAPDPPNDFKWCVV